MGIDLLDTDTVPLRFLENAFGPLTDPPSGTNGTNVRVFRIYSDYFRTFLARGSLGYICVYFKVTSAVYTGEKRAAHHQVRLRFGSPLVRDEKYIAYPRRLRVQGCRITAFNMLTWIINTWFALWFA